MELPKISMLRHIVVLVAGTMLMTSVLAAEPTTAPFPVTLKQWVGEVTIAGPPERIVALGQSDMDAVFALGLSPVAGVGYTYSEDGVAHGSRST